MSEHAGFRLLKREDGSGVRPRLRRVARQDGAWNRKVVGKALLAISALGMGFVLVALWRGNLLQATAFLLLTLLGLHVMLQRAVTLFHASAIPARVRPVARKSPGLAAAGD